MAVHGPVVSPEMSRYVGHDLASDDHIPGATARCGLCSRRILLQYCAQTFAHFFFSFPAQVFSGRFSGLSMLMVNVQLQSRIIHFDLRDSYHRSALAKIVSHPDVAGQESVCGRLRDARCRRSGDKSPSLLSSGCSIRRRRGDGGAQERRHKHDRKNGFHDCAANAVLDITRSP